MLSGFALWRRYSSFHELLQVIDCVATVIDDDLSKWGMAHDATELGEGALPNLSVVASVAKHVALDPLLSSQDGLRAPRGDASAVCNSAATLRGKGIDHGSVACALNQNALARLSSLLNTYFDAVCNVLLAAHRQLSTIEKANQNVRSTKNFRVRSVLSTTVACQRWQLLRRKGELSDDAAGAYDRARRAHERIFNGCAMPFTMSLASQLLSLIAGLCSTWLHTWWCGAHRQHAPGVQHSQTPSSAVCRPW